MTTKGLQSLSFSSLLAHLIVIRPKWNEQWRKNVLILFGMPTKNSFFKKNIKNKNHTNNFKIA